MQDNRHISREDGEEKMELDVSSEQTWVILSTYGWKLLGCNLLCIILMIPVITIPGVLCGAAAVVQQYYRKKHEDMLPTLFRELKADFFGRLGVCLLVALPFAAGLFLVVNWSSPVAYVVCTLVTAAVLITYGWLFQQLALLNLKPMQALRNALLLAVIERKKSLTLLLLQIIPMTLLLLAWPLSGMVFSIVLPVGLVMAQSVITLPVLVSYLVQE